MGFQNIKKEDVFYTNIQGVTEDTLVFSSIQSVSRDKSRVTKLFVDFSYPVLPAKNVLILTRFFFIIPSVQAQQGGWGAFINLIEFN